MTNDVNKIETAEEPHQNTGASENITMRARKTQLKAQLKDNKNKRRNAYFWTLVWFFVLGATIMERTYFSANAPFCRGALSISLLIVSLLGLIV